MFLMAFAPVCRKLLSCKGEEVFRPVRAYLSLTGRATGFFIKRRIRAILIGMLLESFVFNHEYWAYIVLFAGMFFEGEVFLLTAMVFAWQGLMEWWVIIAVTFVGVMLGDLAWYGLGRYGKDTWLGRWMQRKCPAYEEWMEHHFMTHYRRMAVFSKFLYYVNRLTPLIAGWHKMDLKRFLKIHLGAAVIWLGTMLFLGHFLGVFIELIGPRSVLHRIEILVVILFVVFLVAEILLRRYFAKKIAKENWKK